MKAYLAGPMSGYPKFNLPLFEEVTAKLRGAGWDIVSPAELDGNELNQASRQTDGDHDLFTKATGVTWGDLLARDVKVIADEGIEGIINLPGWEESKGARLENYVGLLKGLKFYEWLEASEVVVELEPWEVADSVASEWLDLITVEEETDAVH